ncbi:MAG: DUF2145 domain-containing protein [Casimicrobium sp.]
MFKPLIQFVAISLAAIVLTLAPAHAGRSCEAKRPSAASVERGLALAEKTRQSLDASGAKVVILARAGQDLRKYNLRYSHLGFAVKQSDGRWLITHKLNQCGTAEASLYRQGLAEFFLDDLFRAEGAYVIPRVEAQEALHKLLTSDRARALHTHAYNVVAYPWSTRYQQSNQWAIETLAMAMSPRATNREQAQAWLKFEGYTPTVLNIPPLTRLGGRMTAANVAFDDHPNEKRFSDRIETVTVDSVFAWTERTGFSGQVSVLR